MWALFLPKIHWWPMQVTRLDGGDAAAADEHADFNRKSFHHLTHLYL
jgi:hypothetical protein